MDRRVVHYSEIDPRTYDEHTSIKTLCNREMTPRYRFTKVTDRVTCTICKSKLNKLSMNVGQPNGEKLIITKLSDVGSCGDEIHDSYLSRLGIC